jgi:hypothetical protein
MAQGQQLPAQPSAQSGLPESADFLEFAGFEGIDTKPPRAGVQRNKVAWCDNLMPLGPNNIVAIPDCAQTPFYTAPGGLQIIHFDFFGVQPNNISSGPYLIAFLSDGSAIVESIFTPGSPMQIGPPGTFSSPTPPAVRQYGVQYLLIVTEQSLNAYWVWDGNILYGPGTIGPEVDLTDPGFGYTSAPAVTLIGGSGGGAAFTATVFDGEVVQVTPTAAGSGWVAADPPMGLLLFSGGGGGTSAYALGAAVNGAITSINIQSGGSGFTSIPSLVITDGTGTGAQAIVTGIAGGIITAILVVDCGSNYTSPSITTSGGGGTGFVATLQVQDGVINSYAMVQNGSGYREAPTPFVIAPSGAGFTATATMSGGTVAGINFGTQNFTGSGYTGPVIIGFKGGDGPASGTVLFMPFGIHGYTIEAYQSQVWIETIADGVKKIWSAPGSVVDFGPPDGGGAAPATQSNLRYAFIRLIQSNGFLYEISDSAAGYISGVQTSGTPAITTFSDLNVDPQIGSPFRDSCTEYSRAIMLVNSFGVHAIYGGAVQKVSPELDGVFDTGNFDDVLFGPSSAVTTLFGVHVYCLLLNITDPITGSPRNAIFMWDGKRWWSASQSVSMTKIATLEWGSDISAWGLDSGQTTIRQLFIQPSTLTTKTLQSRLAREPHIAMQKKGWMLYAMWAGDATLDFTWDNENANTPVTRGAFSGNNAEANWARSKAPDTLGYTAGFTMTSTAASFTVVDVLQILLDHRLKT